MHVNIVIVPLCCFCEERYFVCCALLVYLYIFVNWIELPIRIGLFMNKFFLIVCTLRLYYYYVLCCLMWVCSYCLFSVCFSLWCVTDVLCAVSVSGLTVKPTHSWSPIELNWTGLIIWPTTLNICVKVVRLTSTFVTVGMFVKVNLQVLFTNIIYKCCLQYCGSNISIACQLRIACHWCLFSLQKTRNDGPDISCQVSWK